MKIPFQKHVDKVITKIPHVLGYTVKADNTEISKVFREFNKVMMWRYGCVPPYDYVWWNIWGKQVVLFGSAPAVLKLFEEHLEHSKEIAWIVDYNQVIKRGQRGRSLASTIKHYINCYIPLVGRGWATSSRQIGK